ncbi:hypothetical protein L4G92_09140 [Neisseria sp. ZJ106]|uniref:Phage associated membrane protein n=1 Tax=Neisseria lisongii TaxID=2912188 RepID=A0ABY7RMC7_9NEIS|nr:hypothetical protein [Neisseria lisongii]MCF7522194.1 hypothetical protein [Neisseria lisongii]WCL72393.1 hypothetical protein PJU73_01580 [Neisseria lisongii]
MNHVFKWVLMAAMAASVSAVSAHRMHKHKPLALEELPPVCQEYFKRAEMCYRKVGEDKALFQSGNTTFLRQSLPAADENQRVKMCEIALHDFPEKVKNLKCE